MAETFTLPVREDNFTDDAEQLVAWASQFDGVDAHIVYDYMAEGSKKHETERSVPGALNGVTVQWQIGWDSTSAGTADEPGEIFLAAAEAVHVRPGQTITRTASGFEVS